MNDRTKKQIANALTTPLIMSMSEMIWLYGQWKSGELSIEELNEQILPYLSLLNDLDNVIISRGLHIEVRP